MRDQGRTRLALLFKNELADVALITVLLCSELNRCLVPYFCPIFDVLIDEQKRNIVVVLNIITADNIISKR
jgi:hypothetical protein